MVYVYCSVRTPVLGSISNPVTPGLLSKFKWAFRFTNGQRYCAIVYDRLPQSEEPMYHQVSRALREASLVLRRRRFDSLPVLSLAVVTMGRF